MPLIIPIFIPHQGCPHACVFCNQHQISGQERTESAHAETVRRTVGMWLERSRPESHESVQVAFYGGSFTGLPFSRQEELLGAVAPFLEEGTVGSIRLSTRPDYVGAGTARYLAGHGVGTVELGAQAFDDRVLAASGRGHTAADIGRAVSHLRKEPLEIGLQLMLGLPGQTRFSLMQTVGEAIGLRPDFVRLYPVLVLRGTMLHDLCLQGAYVPLTLDKAVVLTAWMQNRFKSAGIRVIRMGLQPGPELEKSLIAGPYHPAFGELVLARLMLQLIRRQLQRVQGQRVVLSISSRDVSIFRGMKSQNIKRLEETGLAGRFILVTDEEQPRHTLKVLSHDKCNHSNAVYQ